MLNNLLQVSRLSVVAVTVFSSAYATADSTERRGGDTVRQIVCAQGGAELLRFPVLAGQASYTGDNFTLSVRARGDDLGSLTLTDKETGDVIEATHGEGFLSAKLGTDEDPANPVSDETMLSIRGVYTLKLTAPSGDVVTVSAGGRRWEQFINLSLQTDEAPDEVLQVTCRREK